MPDLVRCAAGWRKASRKWMVQKGCGTSWKAEVAIGIGTTAVTNGGRRRTGACCGPAAPPVSEQIGGWEAPAPFVCGHRVEVHLKDGRSRKRGSAQPAVFQMSVALVVFLRPELFQAMNKRGK